MILITFNRNVNRLIKTYTNGHTKYNKIIRELIDNTRCIYLSLNKPNPRNHRECALTLKNSFIYKYYKTFNWHRCVSHTEVFECINCGRLFAKYECICCGGEIIKDKCTQCGHEYVYDQSDFSETPKFTKDSESYKCIVL
jgi:mRNA-degrading endonuclease YafQ of YafQ-DinJ toxin-antitoxin module